MNVRKRFRTWGPVKLTDLASGKVKPADIPCTETDLTVGLKQAEARQRLTTALLGILETMTTLKLANSDLRMR